MADEPRDVNSAVSADTQPSEAPTEEQITPVSPEPEAVPREPSEPEMPEGLSEKAQGRFQELANEVRSLREEMKIKRPRESIFDAMRPKQEPPQAVPQGGISPQQYQAVVNQYTDPATGYVDANSLNQALNQMQYNLQAAQNQAADTARRVQDEIAFVKAKAKYPKMDSESPEYNRDFEEAVAREWAADMLLNPSKASYVNAADR